MQKKELIKNKKQKKTTNGIQAGPERKLSVP